MFFFDLGIDIVLYKKKIIVLCYKIEALFVEVVNFFIMIYVFGNDINFF